MKTKKLGITKVVIVGQTLIITSLLVSRWQRGTINDHEHLNGKSLDDSGKLPYGAIGEANHRNNEDISTMPKRNNITMLSKNFTPLSNNVSQTFVNTSQNQDSELKIKERLLYIRKKCEGYLHDRYWQTLRQGGKVWTYEPEQIHYCIIPKVGCTFWKRILRFLGKDYPKDKNIQRPSDIDRAFVHYGGLSNIRQTNIQNPIAQMLMTNGKSFMFTRDPYARLWSAYIDKFLLPDFWRTDARTVVKKLRPNATAYERLCANNVTFHEYLAFINLTYKYGLNEHWDKMHRLCSPCHVQYDVIGKLESFGTDADIILTKFNLAYLKENTTKLDMVREEVTTLTKYNFKLESAIQKGCFDKFYVARKLWLAFQFNGYIDRNADFPQLDLEQSNFQTNPADTFMKTVFKTIDEQNKKGLNLKSQKRAMMLEEYRKIPKSLLEVITKVYDYDFELFQYSKDLFS